MIQTAATIVVSFICFMIGFINGQSLIKDHVRVKMYSDIDSYGPYYGKCLKYQDKIFCPVMDNEQ